MVWFNSYKQNNITRRRKAFLLSVLAGLTLAVGQWGPTRPDNPPPPTPCIDKDDSRDFPSLQKLWVKLKMFETCPSRAMNNNNNKFKKASIFFVVDIGAKYKRPTPRQLTQPFFSLCAMYRLAYNGPRPNVFCFLSSSPLLPQPTRQCLAPACHLSTIS